MCTQKRNKTDQLHIRVRPEDKRVVKAVAERLGMTMSQYLEKLLFDNLYFEIENQRLNQPVEGVEV